MDDRGFITGLKSKFFKNQSAWKLPDKKSMNSPYIGTPSEIFENLRSRQVVKEISYKDPNIKEYSTVTTVNHMHKHPFMIKSNSVRASESQFYINKILNKSKS